MRHVLQTPLDYFKEVLDGIRTADLKKDDRPYQVGDPVILQEYDAVKQIYTGRELPLTLTLVSRDTKKQGLRNGHVLVCFTKGTLEESQLPIGYGEPVAAAAPTDNGTEDKNAAPVINTEMDF